MNCKKCGAALHEGSKFCTNCGEPVNIETSQEGGINNVNGPVPTPNIGANVTNQNIVTPNVNSNFATPNNQNSNFASEKKDNKIYLIIGGVLIVIIIALGIILGIKLFNKDGSDSDSSNNIYLSSASYKVKLNNFTFDIPDNLVYEAAEGGLIIGDENDTWVVVLFVDNGNFNSLKTNINQLAGSLTDGVSANGSAQLKTVDGTEFITIEASQGGTNGLIGLAKLNAMNFVEATIQSSDNSYNYDVLSVLSKILKSATYSETTNAISNQQFNIDLDAISSLAK